ncbi:MAG TPA: hypothetical protein DF613_09735 [Lachnospiraceae bacterium]|nr:hypothetical protein [Lachnospiraceae bacterium]
MATDIQLRVDPGELKAKAREVQGQIHHFESSFRRLSQIIQGTKGYWDGTASQTHQRQFADIQADMDGTIKKLKKHPENLLDMAKVYEAAEETSYREALALAEDVIS